MTVFRHGFLILRCGSSIHLLSSILLLVVAATEQHPIVIERKIKFGRSMHKRSSPPLKRIRSAEATQPSLESSRLVVDNDESLKRNRRDMQDESENLILSPSPGQGGRSLVAAKDYTAIEAPSILIDQSMSLSLSIDLMTFVNDTSMSFSMSIIDAHYVASPSPPTTTINTDATSDDHFGKTIVSAILNYPSNAYHSYHFVKLKPFLRLEVPISRPVFQAGV